VENSDFYGNIIQTVYMPGTAGKKHLSEFSGMAKQPVFKATASRKMDRSFRNMRDALLLIGRKGDP
jgi:hypothetical protein